MENQNIEIQAPEGGNPAGQAPVTEQPSYFDRFSKDFGIEVKDDSSYEAALKRFKNPEPVQLPPQWDEPWAEQFYNGMKSHATEAERKAFLNEFASVNGRDWDSIAQTDHSQVLKAHIRMENPKATEQQVNALYNKDYGSLKTDPKAFYDDEGNPTVESPEDQAALNSFLLQQGLEKALDAINKKKASFAPKQGPDLFGEFVKSYPESAKAVLSSLQFGEGESAWKPGAKDVESATSPDVINSVLSQMYTKDGNALNPEFFARYAAMESFFKNHMPNYASREKAKGTADVLNVLENPSGPNGTKTPAAQQQGISKEAANQLFR